MNSYIEKSQYHNKLKNELQKIESELDKTNYEYDEKKLS